MNNIGPIAGAVRLRKPKSRAAGWVLMALLAAGSWALAAEAANPAAGSGSETVEQKWGIQVSSLHLSAHGYMVDFRYKVLDPEKAATLGDPKAKPYLIDQATGAKLYRAQVAQGGAAAPVRGEPDGGQSLFHPFLEPEQGGQGWQQGDRGGWGVSSGEPGRAVKRLATILARPLPRARFEGRTRISDPVGRAVPSAPRCGQLVLKAALVCLACLFAPLWARAASVAVAGR